MNWRNFKFRNETQFFLWMKRSNSLLPALLYISFFSACYLLPSRQTTRWASLGGWGFQGAWQLLMLRLRWAPLNATDSRSRSHFPVFFPMQKFIGGQQFSFPSLFHVFFLREAPHFGPWADEKVFMYVAARTSCQMRQKYPYSKTLFRSDVWRCSVLRLNLPYMLRKTQNTPEDKI